MQDIIYNFVVILLYYLRYNSCHLVTTQLRVIWFKHQVLVSRCSSVEVGTDQEVDAEEANAAYAPYVTPAKASVTMASSISLLNK